MDKVFWSKTTDSHQKIIDEFRLYADGVRGVNVVPVEITPPNNDYSATIDKWIFKVDDAMGDIFPEWWDKEKYEKMCRAELMDQIAEKIVLPGQCLEKVDGYKYAVLGKIEYVCGSATIKYVYGSATIESVYDSATIESVSGSATIKYVCGSATIKYVCGSATIESVYDSATIESVSGSATIKSVYGSATIKYVYDSATIESVYGSATIESVYGSATIESVSGSATIKYVYGSATIESVYDSATIKEIKGDSTITNAKIALPAPTENAVIIDRSGDKPKIIVAKKVKGEK
jgi:hypothetical protein